jgi:hypothetical protein
MHNTNNIALRQMSPSLPIGRQVGDLGVKNKLTYSKSPISCLPTGMERI